MPQDWISVAEAAEIIKASTRYVRGLCEKGRLESMQVGRAYVVKRSSAEHFKKFEKLPPGRGIPGGAPKAPKARKKK